MFRASIIAFTLTAYAVHAWPEWPKESTYSGVSYGPTPFWCKSDGLICLKGRTFSDRPTGQNVSANLSTVQNVQIIKHASCNLTEFDGPDGVPCQEFWEGNGKVFIASTDGSFCCQGYGAPGLFPMYVPQTNWMNQMKLSDVIGNYNGQFYKGKIYNYTYLFTPPHLSQPPPPGGGSIYFWYYASYPDKKPVAQGEGCVIDPTYANRCVNGAPVYLFTEFSSFESKTFSDYTEFKAPDVCKGRKLYKCYNKGGPHPPSF